MTTLSARALMFDLDGTLIDSTESVEAHWRAFAEWHGLDADQILQRSHGVPHVATIRRELDGRPESEIEATLRRFEELEEQDATREKPMPGAHDLLASLPTSGWAVVTSCWQTLAEARARAAGIELPAIVVAADQLERGKPAPDGYLMGAEKLGVDAADCVVFEDAPSGIEAALAAGCIPVAFKSTTPEDRLRDALGDKGVLIESLLDVRLEITADGFAVHVLN